CGADAICVSGAAKECAGDLCHLAGTCDPKTGACSNPESPPQCGEKGPCDEDACTCDKTKGWIRSWKHDGALCPGGECSLGVCEPDPSGGASATATGSSTASGSTASSVGAGGPNGAGGANGSGGGAATGPSTSTSTTTPLASGTGASDPGSSKDG